MCAVPSYMCMCACVAMSVSVYACMQHVAI